MDDRLLSPAAVAAARTEPIEVWPDAVGLELTAQQAAAPARELYPVLTAEPATADPLGQVEVAAIPYFLWGNREPGAMRVWLRRR